MQKGKHSGSVIHFSLQISLHRRGPGSCHEIVLMSRMHNFVRSLVILFQMLLLRCTCGPPQLPLSDIRPSLHQSPWETDKSKKTMNTTGIMDTTDALDRMDVSNISEAPDLMDFMNESIEPARKYAAMLPINLKDHVLKWFAEDCPTFDYSGFVVGNEKKRSKLSIKSSCVLAGVPFFNEVFSLADCEVKWMFKEGDYISVEPDSRLVLATVTGPVRKLLLGKKIALNVLSRCTSIATQTRKMVDVLRKAEYKGQLAGTRETTPGFRLVENYGMMVGGAHGHHYDLSTITLLKAKHIKAQKCLIKAIESARSAGGYSRKMAVKVVDEAEALLAIQGGADIIVLDAQKIKYVKLVAWHINQNSTFERPFIIECSGSITPENVTSFISNDLSIISTSWIHQGVPHIDFSLKTIKQDDASEN